METLTDKIIFIQSNDFCKSVVESKDLTICCEGDCVCCRTNAIMKLYDKPLQDLKRLMVITDNNIRYKIDKKTFDEIMEELEK